MKSRLIALVLVAMFAVLTLPVMAEDDPTPITGTFTNTTFYFTNTIGRMWIVNIKLWGTWTAGALFEVQKPSLKPYELARSTTATNVMTYASADPAEYLDYADILKIVNTGLANETNSYAITLTNTRKR